VIDARICPPRIQESIRAYVQGRPTRSFLRAVLENDLLGAVMGADTENAIRLSAILAFIYNVVPANIWGSPKAVSDHLRACAEALK
jgi:hypothetical protein